MTEVQKSEPKYESAGAERAAIKKQVWRRKERYEPADAERAAFNQQAQPRKDRPVAPRLNEAGPGDADRARTEVPKSGPKCEPTDAERAALSHKAQPQKEQSVAPRFSEAGLGDGDRAMTEVPEPEPKYEPTDAERAALDRQAQRQKERRVAPRIKLVADHRGFRVEPDHPDSVVGHALIKEALAITDDDFYEGLLGQLCGLANIDGSYDKINESDLGGVPMGRLYLERRATTLLVIDIALLPQWRGRGLGTALLEWVGAQAHAAGKSVTVAVEKDNRAQTLYRR